MQPTDCLMNEHRVIEQVLACLERMADESLANGALDLSAARKAIDFFENFADRCHHAKEEKHLFPLMEARGIAREHGPIGRMLYEHELGRRLLRNLDAATDGASAGDPMAVHDFAGKARAYVEWLRQHIAKEDQHLFFLANRALTEKDQEALRQSFSSRESDEIGSRIHEKYLQVADELADRFQVPKESMSRAAHAGYACCGRDIDR